MKISIICVGKIKEKFYRMALDEYSKRLSRYCKLEILEVADEKTPDNASDHEVELIKDKEGERILKNIRTIGGQNPAIGGHGGKSYSVYHRWFSRTFRPGA